MYSELDGLGREVSAAATDLTATQLLERRRDGLVEWLKENCPQCPDEQRHLDAGTEARAYWHYGYLMAVRDVLALLGSTSTPRH